MGQNKNVGNKAIDANYRMGRIFSPSPPPPPLPFLPGITSCLTSPRGRSNFEAGRPMPAPMRQFRPCYQSTHELTSGATCILFCTSKRYTRQNGQHRSCELALRARIYGRHENMPMFERACRGGAFCVLLVSLPVESIYYFGVTYGARQTPQDIIPQNMMLVNKSSWCRRLLRAWVINLLTPPPPYRTVFEENIPSLSSSSPRGLAFRKGNKFRGGTPPSML